MKQISLLGDGEKEEMIIKVHENTLGGDGRVRHLD